MRVNAPAPAGGIHLRSTGWRPPVQRLLVLESLYRVEIEQGELLDLGGTDTARRRSRGARRSVDHCEREQALTALAVKIKPRKTICRLRAALSSLSSTVIGAAPQTGVTEGFDLDPFARFQHNAPTLQHDKAVAEAEGAENVRVLMAGGVHHQFAVRVVLQNTALKIEAAGATFSGAWRRGPGSRRAPGSGPCFVREFRQQGLHQLTEGDGGGHRVTWQAAEPAVAGVCRRRRVSPGLIASFRSRSPQLFE